MSAFSDAARKAFGNRTFVTSVLILGVCAAGLNSAVAALALHFKKHPVPLVKTLQEGIPQSMGHWVCVSQDKPIEPEMQQVLGTSEYIFRDYVDSRKFTKADIEELKRDSDPARQQHLANVQYSNPTAVMRVAITYYTGIVDTVAHIPERCYIADGFEVKEFDEVDASLGNYPDGKPRDVSFSFLDFEDQTGQGNFARDVGYLFHCNGSYEMNAYKVRQRLTNLFEPYGYYAKVELMTAAKLGTAPGHQGLEANDHGASIAAMKDFLAECLPEVEKCIPDWNSLPLHQKKKK